MSVFSGLIPPHCLHFIFHTGYNFHPAPFHFFPTQFSENSHSVVELLEQLIHGLTGLIHHLQYHHHTVLRHDLEETSAQQVAFITAALNFTFYPPNWSNDYVTLVRRRTTVLSETFLMPRFFALKDAIFILTFTLKDRQWAQWGKIKKLKGLVFTS